jgi:hypothetical protein
MSQQPTGKTPWIVLFAMFAAFAIFFVSTAAIYYRFITTPETDCSVYIAGTKDMDQAVASVDSVRPVRGGARSLQVTLDQASGYSARFFLSAGTYRVHVVDARGAAMIDETVFIPPGVRREYDTSKASPTTRPKGIETNHQS